MTVDELKKKLTDVFPDNKPLPEYMIGWREVVFMYANALRAIEYGEEADQMRKSMFDLIINLPSSRFNQMYGGKFHPILMHALLQKKPCNTFLQAVIPYIRQMAVMGDLEAYEQFVKEGIKK